jgi:hypothetical protein
MSVKADQVRLRTTIQADRRRIARGERPLYRALWVVGPDAVDVTILELPIIHLFVPDDREVLDGARLLVARTLAVDPRSFDVALARTPQKPVVQVRRLIGGG